MTYANQFACDQATEPYLSDYQEEPLFAEFCDHVTIELLNGRDCQGIDSQIFMIDLELAGGDYQLAIKWVSERLTEDKFKGWLNDQAN